MGRKYSFEEVKQYIEGEDGNGCKLISTEYYKSNSKLEIKCKCGNLFTVEFSKFINQNKKQCNECGVKNSTGKRTKTNNQFLCELRNKVGHEIVPLESYRGAKVKIQFKHIICGNTWNATPDNIIRGNSCPKCSNTITTNVFKVIIKNKFGESYQVVGKYINSRTHIEILHKTCGNIFNSTPDAILNGLNSLYNDECPKCCISHLKTNYEFKKEVFNLVGYEYEVIGKYTGAKNKVLMKHNICEQEYEVTPDNFLNNKAKCICSNISKGESLIANFLKCENLTFIQQIKFKDCKNIAPLPFDFGVFDDKYNLKYLIEFDGGQHFRSVEHFGGDVAFSKIKQNDQLKNDYCFKKEIPLLRIPYWEIDNIEEILKDSNEYIFNSKEPKISGSFFIFPKEVIK